MRTLAVLVAVASCAGCQPEEEELPGESIGYYQVVAILTGHTCGAAIPALEQLAFQIELREEPDAVPGYGYWRRPMSGIVGGPHTADGFRFETRFGFTALAPDPELGTLGCDLEQREVVVAEPLPSPADEEEDPDRSVPSLAGSHVVDFTPLPGSDCVPALALAGGEFAALPCALTYELTGFTLDEPPF